MRLADASLWAFTFEDDATVQSDSNFNLSEGRGIAIPQVSYVNIGSNCRVHNFAKRSP